MKKLLYIIILVTFSIPGFSQLSGYRICLDPGHGGHTADDRRIPLNHGIIYWESEGDFYMVTDYLIPYLEGLGASAKSTRTDNTDASHISLAARVQIANEFGADLFQSVHSNAGKGTYTVVLYKGTTNSNPIWPTAKNLSENMSPKIMDVMETTSSQFAADFPFMTYNLGILKNTNMPAIVSECSFHDYRQYYDDAEGLRLKSGMYLQNYAWAVAKSYLSFYKGTGFTSGRVGGFIKNSDGDYLNGVTINVSGKTVKTDNCYNGFFAVDLNPGSHTITITKSGYQTITKTVTIVANTYNDLNIITLTPGNSNEPPVLSSPANGASEAATLTLTWDYHTTEDADYRIQISKSNSGWSAEDGFTADAGTNSTVIVNHVNTEAERSYKWEDGSPDSEEAPIVGNTYYWTVRGWDPTNGISTYSAVRSFTIVSDPPTLTSPTEAAIVSEPVEFTWSYHTTEDADFRIQVANSSSGWTKKDGFKGSEGTDSKVLVNHVNTDGGTTYTWKAGSADATDPEPGTYYWTVRGWDPVNLISAYSSPRKFTIPVQYITLDDFEEGVGHFDQRPTYSGSTLGISSSSTLTRTTETDYEGSASLKAVLYDNTSSSSNWKVRLLSGKGAPSNNLAISNTGALTFWLKTSTAASGAKVRLWIDDNDGLEASPSLTINNDGEWHLYSFDLADYNGTTINTGNGKLDASEVTLDAIVLTQPNTSNTWTVYIDDVKQDVMGSGTSTKSFDSGINNMEITGTETPAYLIYPNPSNGLFSIDLKNTEFKEYQIDVFNMSGMQVLSVQSNEQIVNIDASDLPKGMYMVNIKTNDMNKTLKVIIEK
jgi:N-acetylmuramoyl-L-alanine amidase